MSGNETILVSGAGGFIGGWIVEVLQVFGATDVRAGIRSWSGAARLARLPVQMVLCDVLDKESVGRAMAGVKRVIHCVSGSDEAIIQGTENVLEAAVAHKIERFVHLSTTEVYGNVSGEVDETFPFQYTGNSYGNAKIEAERRCWEHSKNGLPVTVIRPSIVYGPFSRDWTVGFAQRLQSRNWGIYKGYGEGVCNLTYIVDLVCGILLAAWHKRGVGEAFNLVGPESMTWNQYFQKFNSALDLPKLRMIEPVDAKCRAAVMDPMRSLGKFVLNHFNAPLRRLSQGNRRARKLLQYADKTLKTNPRMAELSLYNRGAFYVDRKARKMLGYEAAFGVDRGLDLSVKWLRNVGLVDQPA